MRCTIAIALCLGCCAAAQADRIDFEAPAYTPPSTFPAGWTGLNSPVITTDQATSGSQSMALGLHLWGGYNQSNASADYHINLPTVPGGQFTLRVDIKTSATGGLYGNYGLLSLTDSYMSTLANLRFFNYDYAGDLDLVCTSAYNDHVLSSFVPGQWYRYSLTIDWANNTMTHRVETLEGALVGEHTANVDASRLEGGIGLVAFIGSADNAAPTYIDQVLINEVPEPASLALVGTGAMMMIAPRRRHR